MDSATSICLVFTSLSSAGRFVFGEMSSLAGRFVPLSLVGEYSSTGSSVVGEFMLITEICLLIIEHLMTKLMFDDR
jgi:hypothetical protein